MIPPLCGGIFAQLGEQKEKYCKMMEIMLLYPIGITEIIDI